MARRGRSGGGSGSLDSLLDTLTNVVGILVIMLVVTLLGVRDAVRRILWELPDISQAKLEEYRRLSELKVQKFSETLASIEETEAVLAKLKSVEKEIAELQRSINLDDPQAQLAELQKKVAELAREKAELESEEKADKKDIERLRQQVASLPEPKPAATKVIRMPNPRSPSRDSACVWYCCRYNRVSKMDTEALLEEGLRRIASARYSLSHTEHGRVVKVPKEDRQRHAVLREAANWVFDGAKLKEYFEKNDIGDRDYRLKLDLHPKLNTESLHAVVRADAGQTVEQLRGSVSRFARAVRDMDREKEYARFLVWPDSFEVYVRAREIIERNDVAAGWLLYTEDDYRLAYNFGVNVHGETKPKPRPPAPQPAKPAPKPEKPPKPVTPIAILD